MVVTAARRAQAALFLLAVAVAEVEGGIFISAFSADATRSIVRVFNPTGSAVRFAVYVVNDRPQDSGGTGTGQCTRRSNSGTLGCLAGGGLAEPGIQAQAGLTNNIRHFNRGSMLYLAVNGGVADVIGEQGANSNDVLVIAVCGGPSYIDGTDYHRLPFVTTGWRSLVGWRLGTGSSGRCEWARNLPYTPPSPPPSPSVRLENDDFIVTTSRDGNTNACYLDGQCVRANYGDDQNCTIQAKRDLTLDVTSFNVEGSNYQEGCSDLYGNDCLCDYMSYNAGTHYCGTSGPNGLAMTPGVTLAWHTDGSVSGGDRGYTGWRICAATPVVPTASTTLSPTPFPTSRPSPAPTTSDPTSSPTRLPTADPTTSGPTRSPVSGPTHPGPTRSPTASPTSSVPTASPSAAPTAIPTSAPTASPSSRRPTNDPDDTFSPTVAPTAVAPTAAPDGAGAVPTAPTATSPAPTANGTPSSNKSEGEAGGELPIWVYAFIVLGALTVIGICGFCCMRRTGGDTPPKRPPTSFNPTYNPSEDTNAAAYEDPPANSSPNSENAGNKSGTITYTSVAPVEGSYDVVNNDGSASPASGMYSTVMKSGRGTPVRQQQPIAQIGPGSSTSMYGQTMPMGGPKPIGIEHSYATAPVVAEAEAARKSSRPIHAIVNKPIYDVTVRGDAPPLSAEMIARVSGWLSSGATPEEAEAALKNARGTSPGSYAVYYNQGGVLAVLLKGRRVAQFRLLSDASGKVMIGDQPASFVCKTFGTIHELLAYYAANEINPKLPILRGCIALLGKGAGIKRKDKNRGNGSIYDGFEDGASEA